MRSSDLTTTSFSCFVVQIYIIVYMYIYKKYSIYTVVKKNYNNSIAYVFLQIHNMVIVSTNLIKPFHLNHGLGFPGSPKRYFLALLKAPGIAPVPDLEYSPYSFSASFWDSHDTSSRNIRDVKST